jgi:methylated-DNA-[protein]-cysteine S-methyltransferase
MAKKSFNDKICYKAREIPLGKVATYKSLAKSAGNGLASRAVGTIMHHNDYAHSGVPCHRVVKSSGEVGGYAHGTRRKIEMLKKEGVVVEGGKIDLRRFGFGI